MEEKRICEECGNKTDESICPICGRKTTPLKSDRRERIYLKDKSLRKENWDQEMAGDMGDQESRSYHKENKRTALHMKKGEHPYYAPRNVAMSNITLQQKLFGLGVVIVMIIAIIAIVIGVSQRTQEEDYTRASMEYEPTHYSDFLNPSDADVTIACKVEEHDGNQYLHVTNPSRYFVRAGYKDQGNMWIDADSQLLEPYSDQYIFTADQPESCKAPKGGMEVSELNFYPPDYEYTYTKAYDNPTSVKVVVERELDPYEIEELAHYLYAGTQVTDQSEILNFQLFFGDESTIAYSMYVEDGGTYINITSYGTYTSIGRIAL